MYIFSMPPLESPIYIASPEINPLHVTKLLTSRLPPLNKN